MCRRTLCRTCEKPTWSGCGAHVEQVLAGIPAADRCACAAGDRKPKSWLDFFRR